MDFFYVHQIGKKTIGIKKVVPLETTFLKLLY
jgi:hypothetical protein